MRVRRLLLFLLILFASVPLRSQTYIEPVNYLKDASENSVLFRGRTALRYNVAHEGTPYWYTSDFKEGSVLYDGVRYDGILLNMNAHTRELVAIPEGGTVPIVLERDFVDSFTMDGKHFVNLRKQGYDATEGYYEEMYDDGTQAIYRILIKYASVSYDSTSSSKYSKTTFNQTESYFLKRGDTIYPVSNHRAKRFLARPERSIASVERSARNPMSRLDAAEDGFGRLLPENEEAVAFAGLPQESFKLGETTIYPSLPAGYFASGNDAARDDELLKLINADIEVANFANKVYQIGTKENARGDRAYVSGTIRDVLSGETLSGVAVYSEQSSAFATSDANGAYRLPLPLGDVVLNFSAFSMEDLSLSLHVDSDGSLDVMMKEKISSLKEAVVSAESMVSHRDARMGIEKVRVNTINKIPTAFGEADVLKAVLTLPGVKSVGEASTGFNVRGGSADQNLILFNDGTIFNPSHFFGVFSAFDADVISDIELYKSSIPAAFGGRISSVLDVRGREGNSKALKGSLGLGLLTSRFHLEGPIREGKTTFIVGGRTTYSNWLFKYLPEKSAYSGGGASFSDLNASVTHRIDDRSSLQAHAYWSRDGFSFDGDTTFRYSNANLSLKWLKTLSDRTGMTMVAGYDHYSNVVDDNFNVTSAYSLATGVNQTFWKTGFTSVFDERHTLSYGTGLVYYDLNPGRMSPLSSRSLVELATLDRQRAVEANLYVSDTWKPGDRFSADLGLRLSGFNAIAPSKFYGAPELRTSMKYSFRDNLSVKAGFNSMTQYIHMISNTSSISPMDAWNLSGARLRPQHGWQAASGIYWTVGGNTIDLSLEAYYKRVTNSLDYKSGAVLIMNPNLADDLVTTYGKAYGVELMVKKSLGKLSGWASYTYSRSLLKEMEDRGVQTINGGAWYNAPHDKPHDFKLVGNYKLTHRYSFSMNVDYSTGRPVTIPVAVYEMEGGLRLAYSSRNGYRIPDYFRMDIAFNVDPGHYLRKLTHMSWTIGVYNVTGRKNPYSVYYTTNGGTSVNGYMISVFASPIPYLTLNLKFG